MFVGKRIGTLLKLACSISLDTFFRQNSFLSLIISLASGEYHQFLLSDVNLQNPKFHSWNVEMEVVEYITSRLVELTHTLVGIF